MVKVCCVRLQFRICALLIVVAIAIAVTGGYRGVVLGVPISARRPGVFALVAWLVIVSPMWSASRARVDARLDRYLDFLDRRAAALVALLAIAVGLASAGLGAHVAAGADPYGYVSQALLWLHGNPVQHQSQLAMNAPWSNAEWSFCPLGYRPSVTRGIIVPTYAIGLPLQMAALSSAIGDVGVWMVAPILSALLVLLTYRFAHRVCGRPAPALLTTVLVATSPVVLFGAMQPLSDVPTSAWWILSILAAADAPVWAALGSGLCASLAVLTRPNLVPLLIAVLLYIWRFTLERRSLAPRIGVFLLGVLPGIALTAMSNRVFYGSPLTSGYGALAEIFHVSNASSNLRLYPSWLLQTHTPLIFVALAFVFALPLTAARLLDNTQRDRLVTHSIPGLLFVVILFGCYVFYFPFDHWTYLRFLLPGIPILLSLSIAALIPIVRALSAPMRVAIMSFVVLVIPVYQLNFARSGAAFNLHELFEDRYVVASRGVSDHTPAASGIIGLLQSGSLRFYANRTTVRFDVLPPDALDRVVRYLDDNGLRTFVALENTEMQAFARAFGPMGDSMLARSKRITVDPLGLVSLYGPLQTGSRQP
jgi:hypothetical protein